MGIISWIVLGLVAGALAKFILPGRQPGGCFITILIGIVGALIGGYLGKVLFGFGSVESFDLGSIGIATIGSIILLLVWGMLNKGKS
jgi:uncharacterized membrane protein YeaQ/YmgE (transglycosylase-associated protein family)